MIVVTRLAGRGRPVDILSPGLVITSVESWLTLSAGIEEAQTMTAFA